MITRPRLLALAIALASIALVASWWIARPNAAQARCPTGLVAQGARCCGTGQSLRAGRCYGNATACASGMSLVLHQGQQHCVATPRQVAFSGGRFALEPTDWESLGLVTPREVHVAPFALDAFELTWHRIERCWSDGLCSALGIAAPREPPEPGLPVTSISFEQAAGLCAALGGRLPSADEWLFAAAGSQARRYPWGATGLVCRRAAFGLASGPCARDALTPDLAGARPDGSSPDGVQDLAGNVAEWTASSPGFAARGGSFRSSLAGRLKSWAAESPRGPLDEIGVRCAYDHR